MNNILLTGILSSLLYLSSYGQTVNSPNNSAIFYSQSFQAYNYSNPDSALYYARLLAANSNYTSFLEDLLHNAFPQVFQKMWERRITDSLEKAGLKKRVEMSHLILKGMMADTNQNLVNCATPIYYWTQIQQNENNIKNLIELTNKFMTSQLSSNDIYQNRIGRYALLIYQVISQKKELNKLATRLFATTTSKLKLNQVTVNVDTASREILEKRTWYRFLYAYCNYIEATKLIEQGNKEGARNYFKTAFDYSPDLTDNNNLRAYFYDMTFLLEKEIRGFQDEYLEYLKNSGSGKSKILSTLLTMALVNPMYKEKLRSYYDTNFPNQEPFVNFWQNSISKNLKNASDFSLPKIDGTIFSTTKNKGKWILIDYWGTWCNPCRAEHPDLQTFYKQLSTKDTSAFTLLTIACQDKESSVTSYLSQFNYSFPVAMADNKIEAMYNVKHYPTKILITPQRKYLIIPNGIDWVDFIKKYADL